jgi:LPXTG-motif cell wall-anchored protein
MAHADLALPGDQTQWFRVGDTVTINPGAADQEQAVVTGAGARMTFAAPLTKAHAPGELVALSKAASPAGGPTTTSVPGSGGAGGTTALARTGSDDSALSALGLVLFVVGSVLVFGGRWRLRHR